MDSGYVSVWFPRSPRLELALAGPPSEQLKNAARKRIRVNMVILWSRHGLLESIEKKRIPWSHTKLPQPSPVMTILVLFLCFLLTYFWCPIASVFFRAIGLSGLPFSPIPSAAFGLQQSLAAVTNQFQDAQRCLDLLGSCLVLFTIFILFIVVLCSNHDSES